jgi:hypothetical protein
MGWERLSRFPEQTKIVDPKAFANRKFGKSWKKILFELALKGYIGLNSVFLSRSNLSSDENDGIQVEEFDRFHDSRPLRYFS